MRLLLISPAFFGYEVAITEAFEAAGCHTTFLDERPANSPIDRAVVRIAPKLLHKRIVDHFQRALHALRDEELDAVIVIKGEVTPPWFLSRLRKEHSQALFIYYTYDSFQNSAQGMRLTQYFDRLFSFDRSDVEQDGRFEYKPLFYSRAYKPDHLAREIDVSFIGTLHGDRFDLTQAIAEAFPQSQRYLFYYMAARWFFWLRKFTSRELKKVGLKDVSFTPLRHDQIVQVMQRSRSVIDVQRSGQSGLTMRTFEVLATGARLITTNEEIVKEPFYSPEHILVVPRSPDQIDKEAIRRFVLAETSTPEILTTIGPYSLDRWVCEYVEIIRKHRSTRAS